MQTRQRRKGLDDWWLMMMIMTESCWAGAMKNRKLSNLKKRVKLVLPIKTNKAGSIRHPIRWKMSRGSNATSDAGSRYHCSGVGRGLKPPPIPSPTPCLLTYKETIITTASYRSIAGAWWGFRKEEGGEGWSGGSLKKWENNGSDARKRPSSIGFSPRLSSLTVRSVGRASQSKRWVLHGTQGRCRCRCRWWIRCDLDKTGGRAQQNFLAAYKPDFLTSSRF